MKTIIQVFAFSIVSLATFAQTEVAKSDTAAATQATRVHIGANSTGRLGQKLSTGNFSPFALYAELIAATGSSVSQVNSVAPVAGNVTLTKANIGLSNVPNVDATARANHTGTQAASTITGLAAVATSGLKADIGLSNVLNVAQEPAITAGTTAQYFRGDKTFQPLTAAAIGLSNVANNLQVINAGGVISLSSGTLAARPAFGTVGRVYYATDTQASYFDTGAAWVLEQPAITGDVAILVGATTSTLATVNSNVGTFGGANAVPVVTVNAKGLATAVSTATITPAGIGAASATAVVPYTNVATYSALSSVTPPATGFLQFVMVASDSQYSETNSLYFITSAGKILKLVTNKEN